MTWPIDEEDKPKTFGIPRDERRKRRQGIGREIRHADDMSVVVATAGFDPYPGVQSEDNDVSQ